MKPCVKCLAVFGFWPRAQSTDDGMKGWCWLNVTEEQSWRKESCMCLLSFRDSGFVVYRQSSFISKDFIACSVHLRHFKSKCYQSCDLFRHHPLLQHEPFPKCVCGSQSRTLGQFIQQPWGFMALWFIIPEDHSSSTTCQRVEIKPLVAAVGSLPSHLFWGDPQWQT